MSWLWDWIVYSIPWWLWGIIGLIILSAVAYIWKGLGWKNLALIGGGILSVVLLRRQRQKGWQDHKEKVEDDARNLEERYREIEGDNAPDLERDIERLYNNK